MDAEAKWHSGVCGSTFYLRPNSKYCPIDLGYFGIVSPFNDARSRNRDQLNGLPDSAGDELGAPVPAEHVLGFADEGARAPDEPVGRWAIGVGRWALGVEP